MLRAQPRSLAAVFGDLVGLLLLELRRDMGLGPALVGAFLRFLLSLFLARGVQLRRVLFFLVGFFWSALRFAARPCVFRRLSVARFLPAVFAASCLAWSALSAAQCALGRPRQFLRFARCAASFFSRSARAKEARSLAVCLVPSAMVRPRGAGYPVQDALSRHFVCCKFVLPLLILLPLPLLLLPRPPLLVILHLSLAISLPLFFLGPVVLFL